MFFFECSNIGQRLNLVTTVTAIGTLTSESADGDYVTDKGDCPKHYYQCIQLSSILTDTGMLTVPMNVSVPVCMGQRGTSLVPSISQSLHKQSRYNEKDLCERKKL